MFGKQPPESNLPGDNFKEVLARWVRDNPQFRLSIALHEAGHVMYGLRAGATDVVYHGTSDYPDKPGIVSTASVQLRFPEVLFNLLEIARWTCAGSVVKQALMPNWWRENEDSTDKAEYIEHYCLPL